ncbi:unnamed protein product [Jaminaea pallidilutea]
MEAGGEKAQPVELRSESNVPETSPSSEQVAPQKSPETTSNVAEEGSVEESQTSQSEAADGHNDEVTANGTERTGSKPSLSLGTSVVPNIEISGEGASEMAPDGEARAEGDLPSDQPEGSGAAIEDGSDSRENAREGHSEAVSQAADTDGTQTRRDSAATRPEAESASQPPAPALQSPQPVTSRGSQSLKGSSVFILAALDNLLASKDAKGSRGASKELREAAQGARDLVKTVSADSGATYDPKAVFEPFRLACDPSRSSATQTIALDCVGKMVSYGFFTTGTDEVVSGGQPLPDIVIATICQLPPSSPSSIALQQLKALLALVLAGLARQGALLQAIKTAYDVFLGSKDAQAQAVAQGVLTQMCSATFGRVNRAHREREDTSGETPSNGEEEGGEERVTLKELESRASFDQAAPTINLDSNARPVEQKRAVAQTQDASHLSEREMLTKDAFLVIRTLCKLSMKTVGSESERDMRSQGMRSKLLALHLILGILRSHLHVFNDPQLSLSSSTTGERTPLVQAVKQYLCLSLSRNAVSPVNQVFEVACEIFWVVLSGLRTKLKKEIEVLLNEIFLPILEMKTSTTAQKKILLNVFMRVCRDPQALVEIYLNYDCDRTALDNVYERLINIISRISQTQLSQEVKDKAREAANGVTEEDKQLMRSQRMSVSSSASGGPGASASLSTAQLHDTASMDVSSSGYDSSSPNEPVEMRLKKQSLDCLYAVLRSLVVWSQRGVQPSSSSSQESVMPTSYSSGTLAVESQNRSPRASEDLRMGNGDDVLAESSTAEASRVATPDPSRNGAAEDDPTRFHDAKQRKTILLDGIRRFNQKPKRGIEFLLQHGFIRSKEPVDIARFLLYADGLNKAQIGEYLGEGDADNIAIMHAFVDLINFDGMPFTTALRRFLQAFRLPGESQKIDRYMLKFAERYVAGNPGAFANADTAYVFAYSVIMLNTDAHNPQVKHRMTLKDFLRNNEGIDDGKSLDEEYVRSVYDEIQTNEIKMKDEQASATAPATPSSGLAGAIATVGRDLQREAYVLQSEGMANKTEALFRTMVRAQRRIHPEQRAAAEQFFSASHFEHVRPMFEVAWMAFLAGISGPIQESDDGETIVRCLGAFQDAIHIACLFNMELERNAFVTTLAKFTFLNNLGEMKGKNVEAIKALLAIAQSEGNYLKGSWREILACVSQLERFQLISGGVDERQLPEVGRRASSKAAANGLAALPDQDVVEAGISTEVTVAADMVFSASARLSGEAIVDFVQCLAENSWEEIQSSGMTNHPRLFSLQKLVEISYYNMNRIRLEWSSIWAVLGQHFNLVCTHPNPRVSAFALDSLRQLSNRFLELEELPHFRFQKDFLKPFEYTMRNSASSESKDMVLSCLQQMIMSRIQNMRSGWRTLCGTLGAASRSNERVATNAFELVRGLYAEHFDQIIIAGAFADLTVCLTDFAKAPQAQRIALRSVEVLTSLVPAMLASPVCPLDSDGDPGPAQVPPPTDDPMVRFWFPSLFAFYDIIMNGDDLEVRRVALDALFAILKRHGSTFRPDFWATVCQEVVFPIFAVLRSRSDVSRFSTQEDMSVWLSTTMIQALRNLISLWTHYFETLKSLLPKLLSLLCACICQENDTLARIGTSCLQQLLENNVRKLSESQWKEVVDTLLDLFKTTTAHQLFDPALRSEQSNSESLTGSERRKIFKQIIVKCVLQLLLIETTHELLERPVVYELIPPAELLRLTTVLESSYRFSKSFNADKDLRVALWKVGFMKQLPNLLKQESSSAATLISILVRLHGDTRTSHRALRAQVRRLLVPLGEEVVNSYLPLDPESQARNVAAWTPVVADVFKGICTFHDVSSGEEINDGEPAGQEEEDDSRSLSVGGKVFTHHAKIFYPLAVDLLSREPLAASIGEALRTFFYKVGIAQGMIDEDADRQRRQKVQEGRDTERGLRGVSMENLAAGVQNAPALTRASTSSSSTEVRLPRDNGSSIDVRPLQQGSMMTERSSAPTPPPIGASDPSA